MESWRLLIWRCISEQRQFKRNQLRVDKPSLLDFSNRFFMG